MSTMRYVEGDATQPAGDGNRIIVHICNDVGGWGKGFVLALSRRWPEPEASYRKWHQAQRPPCALGAVQLVQVELTLWVANVIGQKDVRPGPEGPPIRYEAVRQGLDRVAEDAERLNASVHMPRIGCGLAGGHWDRVGPLVQEALVDHGIEVTVYDWRSVSPSDTGPMPNR